MTAILRGKAAKVDLVLEEGTLFDPVFHNLADDAIDEGGEHIPFEDETVGFLSIMTEQAGELVVELGPVDEGLDGTVTVNAAGGLIVCELPPEASLDLEPLVERRSGWYNLVIYPGGDEARALRYAEGQLIYARRATERPGGLSS